MALCSINMAVPINDENHPIFMTPSTVQLLYIERKNFDRKFKNFKVIELILSLLTFILLISAINIEKPVGQAVLLDLTVCAVYGAVIIYPLMLQAFRIRIRQFPKILIIINVVLFWACFAMGGAILSSWWVTRNSNIAVNAKGISVILKQQFDRDSSNMMLASSFTSMLNGLIHLVETVIMIKQIRHNS